MSLIEGYLIEEEDFQKLRNIERRLHSGSDAMRDEGHKLWLVLNRLDMFVEQALCDAVDAMQDALWKAQIREYPGSVQMSIREVYAWCDEAKTATALHNRYIQISMALQYPVVVFYYIEGTKFRGFRFGVEGSEYMSLYGMEV
jgi:hypothetical protein